MKRLIRLLGVLVTAALLGTGLAATASTSASGAAVADRDCGDFSTQAASQRFFLDHGGPRSDPHRLDADGDGIACETLPCPCSYATGGGGGGGGGSTTPTVVRQWARVVRVVDGDTVDVRLAGGPTRRVRLIGINTPETSPRQCGAGLATQSARQLLPRGTRVRLVSDTRQPKKDRYGRLLRYVIKGSIDVNRAQVKRGWARVYVVGRGFTRVAGYRTAQRSAQAAPRGIWRTCR
ncbi:Micrococcal nuclease (thermonuclease) homologs [Nocardioides sp. J9]|uniref:thermonuclease family protein n=1 Tax=Nocardioides sp. J9 TaxID=935844 RepID=UPI0011ABF178|nr:thermonuclease family protein [Nocardioides sp. J9]TWG93060.1 Micrococcal nuclease (thermonuclease) homologs [Nocardioides sp. J9]